MNAGVPAEIRATGAVGGVFSGKIARSAESINAQARTMRVEVDMPNAKARAGSRHVRERCFQLPPRGLVEVPAAALIFRAIRHASRSKSMLTARSTLRRRDCPRQRQLGRAGSRVSKPGDRLVLNISSQIASGQTVAVNEARSFQQAALGREALKAPFVNALRIIDPGALVADFSRLCGRSQLPHLPKLDAPAKLCGEGRF
jgi:hypothetical protein